MNQKRVVLPSVVILMLFLGLSGCKLKMIQNNDFDGKNVNSTGSKVFSFDFNDVVDGFDDFYGGVKNIVDGAFDLVKDILPPPV